MTKFLIEKVVELPVSYSPSTMYVVKAPGSINIEIYCTDNTGYNIFNIINRDEIAQLINNTIADSQSILTAQDIAERNRLRLTKNSLVLVVDASADVTVTSGAALYLYKSSNRSYIKLSEYGAVVVNLNWDNILNRPNSSIIEIDDAVSKRHPHSNLDTLEKLTTDINGNLLYNNKTIVVSQDSDW